MKENLKYVVKLSLVAIKSFIKINLLGVSSTVVFMISGLYLLLKDVDTGHVNFVSIFITLFLSRPIETILYLICLFVSPFIFFSLGNRYIITKLANKLINDKSENLINPFLDKVLNKFQKKQPRIIQNAGDFSLNKLKIIQTIKEDKETNKWVRRIVAFGMKKVQLDDIDFKQENQNFYDIIKNRTIQTLKNISEPSLNFLWITITIQWLILLFIWIFKF